MTPPDLRDRASTIQSWFSLPSPVAKISQLPQVLAAAEGLSSSVAPEQLGRDIKVVSPADLPNKPGLSSKLGQARLLHDLANIELQAMELAVRSYAEYPEAPARFRMELADLALSEGRHLQLCLERLNFLEVPWGHWDAHLSLWNLVAPEDSLIDRILIVHRYLEGSGLDAGESILRRLSGVGDKQVRDCVRTIVDEEVDHVIFGSRWFRYFCAQEKLDPEKEFAKRIPRIAQQAPRRERLSHELRKKAGFTAAELETLESVSHELLAKTPNFRA
jgi:uncharacterized ferritin-like protein (DUF455 family)